MPDRDHPGEAASDHVLNVQQLFVRHTRAIRGFVLCLAPGPGDADDIMQEVFLVLTRKADQFQAGTDFVAWVCSIARFEALNHLRRVRRNPVTFSPQTAALLADAYTAPAELDDWVEAIRRCMERLSPSARQAIHSRYGDGRKPADIASAMGIKPETVYVTLSKARAALRSCMEGRLAAEGADV
ncbi:MAG: sigma-70 family RNA polymerase sigma factor [Planctomycetes bacterium]|nr:sigma-70 family RNA polymerase sigma factor [Planctomycetota bacterium]